MTTLTFLNLFFELLCGHAFADFAFQGEFIAKFKSRWTASTELIWPYVLTAHSLIHGFFVLYITQNLTLGIAETISHWVIDFGKCENWYSIHVDQALHVICKILWVLLILNQRSIL